MGVRPEPEEKPERDEDVGSVGKCVDGRNGACVLATGALSDENRHLCEHHRCKDDRRNADPVAALPERKDRDGVVRPEEQHLPPHERLVEGGACDDQTVKVLRPSRVQRVDQKLGRPQRVARVCTKRRNVRDHESLERDRVSDHEKVDHEESPAKPEMPPHLFWSSERVAFFFFDAVALFVHGLFRVAENLLEKMQRIVCKVFLCDGSYKALWVDPGMTAGALSAQCSEKCLLLFIFFKKNSKK